MKLTGGPAFPHHIEHPNGHWPEVTHAGMTLRDYFAAKVMQGIVHEAEVFWEGAAPLAYQYADAMLKERSK